MFEGDVPSMPASMPTKNLENDLKSLYAVVG
jgi:hypothetical protein